jgi:hypothetical protein
VKATVGPLSQRTLEHYSHVRFEAKRKALEELDAWREREGIRIMLKAIVQ